MDQVFTPQLSPPAPQREIIHGFHPVCKQIPGQARAWISIMSRAFCGCYSCLEKSVLLYLKWIILGYIVYIFYIFEFFFVCKFKAIIVQYCIKNLSKLLTPLLTETKLCIFLLYCKCVVNVHKHHKILQNMLLLEKNGKCYINIGLSLFFDRPIITLFYN